MTHTVYQIPICPFSQRVHILATLKGIPDELQLVDVDITIPRSAHILKLSRGTTALPVMEIEGGRALKESMVLMDYIEDKFNDTPIRRKDSYERAIENLMVNTLESNFVNSGYGLVLNADKSKREACVKKYLDAHEKINDFLLHYGTDDGSPWMFDRFGWVEAVFTPFFQRWWFVEYYEDVHLPENDEKFNRVIEWRNACVEHPMAQQVEKEEIIKIYYDYSKGASNGGVPSGRTRSSCSFLPHWRERPMPPKGDKYGPSVSDEELGLL